jgi:hypothetical protein
MAFTYSHQQGVPQLPVLHVSLRIASILHHSALDRKITREPIVFRYLRDDPKATGISEYPFPDFFSRKASVSFRQEADMNIPTDAIARQEDK